MKVNPGYRDVWANVRRNASLIRFLSWRGFTGAHVLRVCLQGGLKLVQCFRASVGSE